MTDTQFEHIIDEFRGAARVFASGLDPALTAVRVRKTLEVLCLQIAKDHSIDTSEHAGLFRLIDSLTESNIIPRHIASAFHAARTIGNIGAHMLSDQQLRARDSEYVMETALRILEWYLMEYESRPQIDDHRAQQILTDLRREMYGPQSNPPLVFLCYAREDYGKVYELYQQLKNRGFSPWMDKKDLLPGQDWEYEIQKTIQHADFFVVCISQFSATKRGFVQKEVRFALDALGEIPAGQIYFIPLRIEDCEIPDFLRKLQWVDYFEPDGFDLLCRAIESRGANS
jgi:hypothetical protein